MIRVTAHRAPSHLDAICKRAFDVAISLSGLVLTLPLTLVIALAVLADGGGPVFYRGWRVGLGGRVFRIVKFRTMAQAAPGTGGLITVAGDKRVTRIGRLLRRTKLDELPQLYNVLRGDMSLVGPRPEHPNYVRLYTEQQRRLLSVRPGITGVASIHYRNEEALLRGDDPDALYRTVVMPDKLRLELEYLDQRGLWSDFGLIVGTLRVLSTKLPQR